MVVRRGLDCVLLEKYTVAPAPSRDYYGIKVCPSQIFVYHWKVSRYQALFPTVQRFELDRFVSSPSIQEEIEYIFGKEILIDILNAANGKCDCLSVLPYPILIQILSFLPLKDIAAVALTCKRLSNMVSTNDDLWKKLFRKYFSRKELTREEKSEVRYWGWRRLFKNYLLYMNMKISRLTPFSLQDRKAGKLLHKAAEQQRELSYSSRSSVTNSQITLHKDIQKNIKLSGHTLIGKQMVITNNTMKATAMTRVTTPPAPKIGQSKTSTKSGCKSASCQFRNASNYQNIITTPQPIPLFKRTSSTISASKQDPIRFSPTVKINTTKNTVKSPKLNKMK